MAPSPVLIASRPDRLLTALAHDVPVVCGIVNVTPDSFSDGGRYLDTSAAVEHGLSLVAEGAGLLDVGGESTRPGSRPPSVTDEIDRVVPVIAALARRTAVPISVDTSRPEVMREAVAAGATLINDVRALRVRGALRAAAELQVPVCLMHMQGDPESMQKGPTYADVVGEVRRFLVARITACLEAGIPSSHILVDPGFGFGKRLTHNLELLSELHQIADLGLPVMAGLSRKGMVGAITGRDVDQRLAGSVAAALVAAQNGAAVLRVHDVAATMDAVSVLRALVYRGPAHSTHVSNRASAL
ncbi:dihydropteroate synthase [Rhodococcus sp. WS4]|nr:dihydropteroate synthase [Rhodococcus sp. WS4]